MLENEDIGFSRPDSEYESAQVIGTLSPAREEEKEEPHQSLRNHRYQELNQNMQEESMTQGSSITQGSSKTSFRLPYLGLVAGLLILACLYLALSNQRASTAYSYISKDAIEILADADQQRTYVFDSYGNILARLDGYMQISCYSADHSAALLISSTTSSITFVNRNTVYDFHGQARQFSLSEDGKYVLYTKRGDQNKSYLYLYDVVKQKETLIDNREGEEYALLNISRGAKLITFVTYQVMENGAMVIKGNTPILRSYIMKDGEKPVLYQEQKVILAASSDGKYIYYIDYTDGETVCLYVDQEGRSSLLSEQSKLPVYSNADLSELLFQIEDDYGVSSKRGQLKELGINHIASFIMPKKSTQWKMAGTDLYGISSFRHKLFYNTSFDIHIIDSEYKTTYLATAANGRDIVLSRDGSSLLFRSASNELIKISDLHGARRSSVLVDNIQAFAASQDLTQIYYQKKGQLYYYSKKGSELLSTNQVSQIALNHKGDILFFLEKTESTTGKLFYSVKGSKPVALENGEAVKGLREWNFGVIYQKEVNGKETVYYNREGTDFTIILDGVDFLRLLDKN